jgi:hypothetical protein
MLQAESERGPLSDDVGVHIYSAIVPALDPRQPMIVCTVVF